MKKKESRFNYREEIYKTAFQHKSYCKANNNERLEFLGDAILCFVVSEYIYDENKTQKEGYLSKKRAVIVARKHLNMVGKRVINKELLKTKTETISDNIYGNALEALIGAIYIERGIKEVKQFIVDKIINSEFIDELINTDYKSNLQKIIQKNQKDIKYNLTSTKGPEHDKEFYVTLFIDNKQISRAKGRSLKEAEQNAAKKALKSVS